MWVMTAFDDAGLLQRYAAERDAAAFAELVHRYADLVYATARRVTGDASAAEDVSQDCFLRLAQRAGSISGSVAAWLHRTSVNRSLEILRSDRARRERESAAAQRGENEPASLLIAQVDEALASLPDDARLVLTEHFLLGRTQNDIAAALRVSQPTISRKIEQAVKELRDRLRAAGIAPAAMIALPTMLEHVKGVTAPPTLPAALNKIGLSGVNSAAAAATTGPAGMIALKLAAAIVAVAGVALIINWRANSTTGGSAGAVPAIAATTRATTARGERFELDDLIERDDEKDDDEDESDED
jgi:RNA polymerase sigma factor (sigma-70 family)